MKAELKDLVKKKKPFQKTLYKEEVKSDNDIENWINKTLSIAINIKEDAIVSSLCIFGIDKLTLRQSGIDFKT